MSQTSTGTVAPRLALRASPARVRGAVGVSAPALVVLLYGLSRALAHHLGVEPDLSPLPYFWQYLDEDLLRHDLWRSVWFDHAQPPLYNLWLGGQLQLADALGVSRQSVFQLGMWGVGLAGQLLLYALARRLGASRKAAFVATAIWIVHPASLLYDHFLFYSAPVAALLLGVFVVGHRAVATGRRRDLLLCFGLAALVVLGRSLFHLVWWVAVALTVVAFARRRRRALACALVPFALAALPFVKNAVYYDAPASSSWLGMSLAKLAVVEVPTVVRERLHEEGAVSELALRPPFSPLRHYAEQWRALPPGTPDHPAVRAEQKVGGHPNYHHAAYVPIAAQYLADARSLLRTHPRAYRRNVRTAFEIFWKSTSTYAFLQGNREHLEPLDLVFDALWGVPSALLPEELEARWWGANPKKDVAWFWVLLVALAAAWGSRRVLSDGTRRPDRALRACLALVLGTGVYVMLVSCLVEVGENNRFRLLVEPALLALVAAGFSRAARRRTLLR